LLDIGNCLTAVLSADIINTLRSGRVMIKIISRSSGRNRGQSFVELAIVLPLLLFLLIGFVEVGAVIYNYLSMLDVAREAARFASEHDPAVLGLGPPVWGPVLGLPYDACRDVPVHYYYDTACVIISDPGSDPNRYIGLNPNFTLNPATDDVTISVFTIVDNSVAKRWPNGFDTVWSLYGGNWTRNCDGTLRSVIPFITDLEISNTYNIVGPGTLVPSAPTNKGSVLVEIYYCHEQLLNLPLLSDLLPNPIPLHAFAFMPAPAAAPTPTPLP
jgi:hypothetical protein